MIRTSIAIILGLIAAFAIWRLRGDRERPAQDLNIAFTCDVHGRLVPCGCFSGQMGGLTRIGSILEELSPEDTLKLDDGNVIEGPADYQRIQYRYLLQAFQKMGYDAVNLGYDEARLDVVQLRELSTHATLPLLSANLLDRNTGAPIFPAYRVVQKRGWRIALVGVMDEHIPADTLGAGLSLEPMSATLSRILPEVRKQADAVILLAFADEAALHRLAREFYELQVILGGNVSQPAQHLERENRSLILYTTNQSRALGTLSVTISAPGKLSAKSSDVMLVSDKIPESPEIRKLAGQYRDEVRRTKLSIDDPAHLQDDLVPGVKSAATYVGSQSCAVCHAGAARVWEATGHSHAFQALLGAGADADPNCIGCHTVGFGTPSGYRREFGQSWLTDVGCENCHGPGSVHVAQHQAGKEVTSHFRKLGPGDCQKCHHGEFSRPFEWKAFWPAISHTKEPRK